MDPKAKIEELEQARAKRQEELAQKESDQRIVDMTAREALDAEHDTTAEVRVIRFIPGFPTCAYVKMPDSSQYKRYTDMIGKAVEKKSTKDQRNAFEVLAKSCWVYPLEQKDRDAMLDRFPGILTPIGMAALALVEGKAEEEGKG